jgi:hypothetical protein
VRSEVTEGEQRRVEEGGGRWRRVEEDEGWGMENGGKWRRTWRMEDGRRGMEGEGRRERGGGRVGINSPLLPNFRFILVQAHGQLGPRRGTIFRRLASRSFARFVTWPSNRKKKKKARNPYLPPECPFRPLTLCLLFPPTLDSSDSLAPTPRDSEPEY